MDDQTGSTAVGLAFASFNGLIHLMTANIDDPSLFTHDAGCQVIETTTIIKKNSDVVGEVLKGKELT